MLLVVSASVVVGLQVLSVSVRSCLQALSFVFLCKIEHRVDSHQLCGWGGVVAEAVLVIRFCV